MKLKMGIKNYFSLSLFLFLYILKICISIYKINTSKKIFVNHKLELYVE